MPRYFIALFAVENYITMQLLTYTAYMATCQKARLLPQFQRCVRRRHAAQHNFSIRCHDDYDDAHLLSNKLPNTRHDFITYTARRGHMLIMLIMGLKTWPSLDYQ